VEGVPTAVGRALQDGADAFLDAATDKRTTTALDRLAGTELRLGVLVAAMAASAVKFALRGRLGRRRSPDATVERASPADEDLAADVTA
jgi:hypothetical protein